LSRQLSPGGQLSTQATRRGIELEAWVSFLRAHTAITRQLDRELVTEHGLTINDYEVLLHLSRAPHKMLRRVDLAERVLLTPSGITRLLDGLERSALVCKASCASDARVVYAKLTDKGAKRLEAASKSHLSSVRALFAQRFDGDELEQLAELLGRLPQTNGPSSTECSPG
jgi:DNA-binding MarR family transcriptional regulator